MSTGSRRSGPVPLTAAAVVAALVLMAAGPSARPPSPGAPAAATPRQSACPSTVSGPVSIIICVIGQWSATFSAGSQDTLAMPSAGADTVHLSWGSLFLQPVTAMATGVIVTLPMLPGGTQSPASVRRPRTAPCGRLAPCGRRQFVVAGQASVLFMGFAPDSSIVAVVAGSLPTDPNLAVGCQTRYWANGTGTAVDSATTPFTATVTGSLTNLGVTLPAIPASC